jgi:histidyl-tRNA synthetase
MKQAAKSGARFAAIVGEDERADGTVTVRDLVAGQQVVVGRADLIEHLRKALHQ